MAPYRNSRTGAARTTRTQIDHDVFEGLPVRHWRKKAINVNTAPEKETTHDVKSRNLAWPELEMPRDAHLLSEMSQHLLRAARMPQAKKAAVAPSLEDEKEAGEDEDADGETDLGFIAKRWAVMPKEMEGPEPEFLAKRRKGLPSTHGGSVAAIGGMQQMRKTKIRKVDTSGNSSILEVLVPDGQTIDGEIFEEETSPTSAPAPGTIVEGVGVVNAEGLVIAVDQGLPASNRRRPPPPKRKAKGPGRGRKKKVAFAGANGKPTSMEAKGAPDTTLRGGGNHPIDGEQRVPGTQGQYGDESMPQDGDQEGDEGSEEGSELEEGEEGDREEGELSPLTSPPRSSPRATSPNLTMPAPRVDDSARVASVSEDAMTPTQTGEFATVFVSETKTEPGLESKDDDADKMLDEPTSEPPSLPERASQHNILDQPVYASMGAPADAPMTSPSHDGHPEAGAATSLDHAHSSTPEPLEEPMLESGRSPKAGTSDVGIESLPKAIDQLPIEETGLTPSDSLEHAITTPVRETPDTPMVESPAQSVPQPPRLVPSAPTIEPPMRGLPGLQLGFKSDQPGDATLGPLQSIVSDSEAQHATEDSVESAHHTPMAVFDERQADSSLTLSLEVAEEAKNHMVETEVDDVSSSNKTSTQDTRHQTPEGSMPAPIATRQEKSPSPSRPRELRLEPMVERTVEATEQEVAFTRPTASPRAPTPSPPTPNKDKFGLRAPYYSPKAPTMSPPTPVDESMASSPELPLREQSFQLPPQLDDMQGAVAPTPSMREIAEADRIAVEAASQGGPQLHAQISVDHNPLDGLAAPRLVYDDGELDGERENESEAQFPDGDEDLLGSLERSLDRQGRGS